MPSMKTRYRAAWTECARFMRENGRMSEAGEFIDLALQRESSWSRAEEAEARHGGGHRYYGASVGAVRGTVRDALRRHPELTHDDITALSSELWDVPVFERRLAAVVLLQSSVRLLTNTDLTRIEGFVRSARMAALVGSARHRRRRPPDRRARHRRQGARGQRPGPLGAGSRRLAPPRRPVVPAARAPRRRGGLAPVRAPRPLGAGGAAPAGPAGGRRRRGRRRGGPPPAHASGQAPARAGARPSRFPAGAPPPRRPSRRRTPSR